MFIRPGAGVPWAAETAGVTVVLNVTPPVTSTLATRSPVASSPPPPCMPITTGIVSPTSEPTWNWRLEVPSRRFVPFHCAVETTLPS